ncbi:uncharacterized protein ACR2FA_002527 [Aphomia sociella]
MRISKSVTTALLASWIIISMFYYNIFNLITYSYDLKNKLYNTQIINNGTSDQFVNFYNGTQDYLINTPGCYIPNYERKIVFKEAKYLKKRECGHRVVYIKKRMDDEVEFLIDKAKLEKYMKNKQFSCCYQFVSRSTIPTLRDVKITYSTCVLFTNETRVKLKEEVITVKCSFMSDEKLKIIYEDAYMIVKKRKNTVINGNNEKWKVLLLGMDTMSRARTYYNMHSLMHYFKQNHWLDYRGYHKVGFNTFPNVMSILTGKRKENLYGPCSRNMSSCNEQMIWTTYKKAGFRTAFGEDNLSLPDTFHNYGGFEILPTDHYMRPLFLTGETAQGNIICTKKISSGKQILEYANQFVNTYKDENSFGFFWINSYSHNLLDLPSLFDEHLVNFFKDLHNTTLLNNTFIIFLSDHGIRYGKMRYSIESYYEERLPTFFMWVPYDFRKLYPKKYNNLQLNQHRLTTPYDLYATLWEVLKMTNNSIEVPKPEACPNCTSLFDEKPIDRTCTDAGIDKKWCSCHELVPVTTEDPYVIKSLELTISHIQNISQKVETKNCMKCSVFKLKTVLRSHSYVDSANNKTYYVVAFLLSPGDVGYEATVEKDGSTLYELDPTTTITEYNTRGNCVIKPFDRSYCVCETIPKCFKKHKTK